VRAAPPALDVPLPPHERDLDVAPHDLKNYDAKP
jgi:hypothetical protein